MALLDTSTKTYPTVARPSLLEALKFALAVGRSRRALSKLTDDQLADIGVSRKIAEAEASRPAWDAPDNWRR
ncbi:MAG: DUF1127 domain-containing protein [Pseudomonadota bacterium]